MKTERLCFKDLEPQFARKEATSDSIEKYSTGQIIKAQN